MTLTGMAQLDGRRQTNPKVVGSIDVYLLHRCFSPFLLPFPSLKINK